MTTVGVVIDRKTAGHIPKDLSKTFKRFLTLRNCTIKCTVIGKRVNHGAGYGLEIPVNFKFFGSQSNSVGRKRCEKNYSEYRPESKTL